MLSVAVVCSHGGSNNLLGSLAGLLSSLPGCLLRLLVGCQSPVGGSYRHKCGPLEAAVQGCTMTAASYVCLGACNIAVSSCAHVTCAVVDGSIAAITKTVMIMVPTHIEGQSCTLLLLV
jgi:hypothetical protein